MLAVRARRRHPGLALSFNSYAQAVAARAIGVPFVTVADYEYQPANHLAFRVARTVIVPKGFDDVALRRQGARSGRVVYFDGLKEHVTLEDFTPDPGFPARLQALGVPAGAIVATMRPPATSSAYHRFSNEWFYDVVAFLASKPGVAAVVLPRYPAQEERIRQLGLDNVVIPSMVLDGLNLVYWSDLVVSGGGSMNREAVVLGTPAYTVFAGTMAGVDVELIRDGRMVELRGPADLHKLVVAKRGPRMLARDERPLTQILAAILHAGGWSEAATGS